MAQELSPGDRVSWNTSQGRTRGEVVRKESTGAEAAHHRKALRKLPKR